MTYNEATELARKLNKELLTGDEIEVDENDETVLLPAGWWPMSELVWLVEQIKQAKGGEDSEAE